MPSMPCAPVLSLNAAQRSALLEWLLVEEGIALAADELVETPQPFAHYVMQWGVPQEQRSLPDGTLVAGWRGQGYALWVADFGELRAATAF